jgi:hypothetical protein
MHDPEKTRLLGAIRRSYDGRVTIKVKPNEAGGLECAIVVERTDKDFLLGMLDANIEGCRGIQLTYRVAESDDQQFAVILTFSREVNIVEMFRFAERSMGTAYYGRFQNEEFEFETDPDDVGAFRVRMRNNGTNDLHRFQLLVYAEHVGASASQIAPTWPANTIQTLQESAHAGEYQMDIWYADEFNSATPGFDTLELDVEVLRPGTDPLADMLDALKFLPPQNHVLDAAG